MKKWEAIMSNFIGMVFATLKKEGIDTSKMDTSEAIAKYNEIQGGGGGSSAKGEEIPKTDKKTATKATDKENLAVGEGTTEKDSADATVSKKEIVEDAPGQTKSFSEAVHQATRDWQKGEDEDWNDYHQRIDASGRELSKHLKVGDSFLYTNKEQNYQETMKICKIGKDGIEYAQDKHYVKKGEAICGFAGLYQYVGSGRMKFAKNNQTDDSAKLQKTMGV